MPAMIDHSPFQFILTWGMPLVFIAGNFLMLVACIVGATYPTMRREFIWLALGTLVRCFASAMPLVSNILSRSSDSSSRITSIQTIGYINAALSMFSMLFYMIGFILLAVRARSLPLVRR